MTTTLLVNNTEQVQPQDANGTHIKLYGRTAANPDDRITVTVRGFRPYFFAEGDDVDGSETYLLSLDCVDEIEETEKKSLVGEKDLVKIYTPKPQDVPEAADIIDGQTYASDVPFLRRFRIDTGLRAVVEVPGEPSADGEIECNVEDIEPVDETEDSAEELQDVDPRTLTFDIEVDDRGDSFPTDGEERILSLVSHDNYDDEVVVFLHYEDQQEVAEEFDNSSPDDTDELRIFETEKEMLDNFAEYVSSVNPDLITGWNVDDFDAPYLIQRMQEVGVDPGKMSNSGWSGISRGGEARIKGRTIYDLLHVYKKNSWTELRSYSLDDVAREELDEEKIEFNGSYYDLYENDIEKFVRYNVRDTLLTARINSEAGTVKFRDVLRREVGVDFEDSYDNKDFVDMMCRRKLKELDRVGPRRPSYGEEPDSDFEGALVLEPYTGVTKNVVGIDLASLYPYTMAMLNASPETKVDEEKVTTINGRKVGQVGDKTVPVCRADNGQHFRLDEDGLFKQLVDEAISLKSDYKQLREDAETEEEYKKWDERYGVAKTITNSLYGTTGWERFFLYDKDVAEAVTLTGQAVTKCTAQYVEETGFDVIYGDTDSCYIKFPDEWSKGESLNGARELCTDLNGSVYPELAEEHGIPGEDNLWDIEVEVYCSRYFQAGRKKRYAYLATWKDGHELEDPDPTISGFSSKRSDSAQLTVETEKDVIDSILSGNEDAVGDIVFNAANEIMSESPDWERIGIPGGLRKRFDERRPDSDNHYTFSSRGEYPQDAHPRAAWNANRILGTNITEGDKPKRVYLEDRRFEGVTRQIDVIAFENAGQIEEIEDELQLDRQRMISTLLIKPLQEITSAVGVDIDAAISGQKQTGLGAFTNE